MSKRKSTKHCCFVLFCGAPRALLSEQSYKHPLCVFFPEPLFVRLHRPDHRPSSPGHLAGWTVSGVTIHFLPPSTRLSEPLHPVRQCMSAEGRFRLACHVPQPCRVLQVILNVAVRQQNAAAHNGRANERSDHSTCAAIFCFRVRLRLSKIAPPPIVPPLFVLSPAVTDFIFPVNNRRAGCLDRSPVGHFCRSLFCHLHSGRRHFQNAEGPSVPLSIRTMIDDLDVACPVHCRQIHRNRDSFRNL